ncbi:MAG: tetratricopeptide repeat protein [Syntrophales bacterium]
MSKKSKKKESGGDIAIAQTPARGQVTAFFMKPVIHALIIIVLGFLVYSNTFQVPFAFDDQLVVSDNIGIKDLKKFLGPSLSVKDHLINFLQGSSRHIGFLSFALNYKVHALQLTGYHVVNLFIHLINALLVYGFVLLTFRTPFAADYLQRGINGGSFDASRLLALFSALLFVSHPVQTQAVTYITQRFASLATLFYLLSLVLYISARVSSVAPPLFRYVCYGAAIIAAVVAMKTKEISFTLPFMIILYEIMFFTGGFKRRLLYLFPFLLTIPIIPMAVMGISVFSTGGLPSTAGSLSAAVAGVDAAVRAASFTRWDYLLTQFRVIVTYIRLLFFPVNQNLDYDYPIYRIFFTPQVLLSFLFLLAFFSLGVYLFYASGRKEKNGRFWLRTVSFGIFWFFVTMSVESSIIPIQDVIFEHRVYLPAIGFFLALICGVAYIVTETSANQSIVIRKAFIPVMILVVLGLSVTAYARNAVWRDEITFWEDVVRKSPGKVRPHYSLGLYYALAGRFDDAIKEHQMAIILNPDALESYNDVAAIAIKQNRLDDAARILQAAFKVRPGYLEGHLNMGLIYEKQGRLDDALREYQMATTEGVWNRATPVTARNNMGVIYARQGRLDDAVREYQTAIKLNPDYAIAHNNLSSVYKRQGRLDDAIKELQIALQLKPDYAEASYDLGRIYVEMQKYEEAKKFLQAAIALDPANIDARNDLAVDYIMLKQYEQAMQEFEEILRIKPNHEDARNNLAKLQQLLKPRK